MKKIFILSMLFILGFWQLGLSQDCKVAVPNLQGSYEGGCKKGLAWGLGKAIGKDTYEGSFKKGLPNGQGKYLFADGSAYEGNFKKGMKNGHGKLTVKISQKDSVIEGIWKKDVYVGKEKVIPYNVNRNQNVTRYRITKIDESRTQVNIRILRDGSPLNVGRLVINSSSGRQVNNLVGTYTLEGFQLPLKITVEYEAPGRVNNSSLDCFFDFTITENGYYEVQLHN